MLFDALARVGELHVREPLAADALLADLIALLRAMLPGAKADNSTVEAFHRAGVEAGYRSNGGPGERPVYHEGYYGAFILDPDGNNVEVVNHNRG